MSYHYAGFHCNCRLRLAIKERGEPRRQEVDEDGRTCRSRWKGEIIVGARDSHAKHPLYLEPASQGVWNHRNAPINLILPFAGSSPMPPSLLYLPLTFFLPASTFLPRSMVLGRELPCIRLLAATVYPCLGNYVPASQLSRGISNFYGNHIRRVLTRQSNGFSFSKAPLREYRCDIDGSGEVEKTTCLYINNSEKFFWLKYR